MDSPTRRVCHEQPHRNEDRPGRTNIQAPRPVRFVQQRHHLRRDRQRSPDCDLPPGTDVLVETAALLDVDARPVLPRITAPVLLIFGDKDSSFSADSVEETARLIPDCTLIRYPKRGHGGAAWDKRTPGHILDFINHPQKA